MRIKVLGLAFTIICICFYLEQQKNQALQNELDALKTKLAEASKLAAALPKRSYAQRELARALPEDSLAESSAPTRIRSGDEKRIDPQQPFRDLQKFRAEFQVTRRMEELGQVLTLSDDEKARLEERLKDYFANQDEQSANTDQDDNAELKELLAQELGADRAELYLNVQKDREMKNQNERIELASTMFTKYLSLAPDQQSQVTAILRDVDQRLGTPRKMLERKLQELHSRGEDTTQGPAEAMKQYGELSKTIRDERRAALNEQLKGVLTPDQFNTLLSEQANSQETLWGLRGY